MFQALSITILWNVELWHMLSIRQASLKLDAMGGWGQFSHRRGPAMDNPIVSLRQKALEEVRCHFVEGCPKGYFGDPEAFDKRNFSTVAWKWLPFLAHEESNAPLLEDGFIGYKVANPEVCFAIIG